jgi:CYTH domain-containing protein
MEIERKFLLDRLPADLGDGRAIEQGYLAIGSDGVEVRVRLHGDQRTLTIKSGPAHVRTEEEFDIDERRFEALWPLTEGRRIVKTRHRIDLGGGLTAEVDVYGGAHEGLAVAEVEFADEEASDRFQAPSWLGREVTGDAHYANQQLALSGCAIGRA